MFFFLGNNFYKTPVKTLLLFLFVNMNAIASPTSNVPSYSEGGYVQSCYSSQVSTVNVSSIILPSKEEIPTAILLSGNNKEIKHGEIILVNCEEDNYVFGELPAVDSKRSRNFEYNPAKSYRLACNNGALLKVKPFHYCDKKCDASPLKKLNYKVPQEIIHPGTSAHITCPDKQTTKNGETFELTCTKDGVLLSSSGTCFPKQDSCTFPPNSTQSNTFLESGTMINCKGKYGAMKLTCFFGSWRGDYVNQEQICNQECLSGCKESIQDVVFNYDAIEEAIISALQDSGITIEELISFCQANPDNEECKKELPMCEYSGKKYVFGTEIILNCEFVKDKKAKFLCYDIWIFREFHEDESDLNSMLSLAQCGINSQIISVEEPSNDNKSKNNFRKKMTLKDYKIQKLKMEKANLR
jgi:hypothetical protein